MAQNVYECMCILDSNKYAQNPNGVSGQIPEVIQKHGGEVLVSRLYNEQKLAYPIGHHKKGTYWITYFKLNGPDLVKINGDLRINENVIRFLTLKIPEKVAGPLIEHALGGKPKTVEAPVAAAAAPAVPELEGTEE
jgi:small subunit ribosomal protein S6